MPYRVKLKEDGSIDQVARDAGQSGDGWCSWTVVSLPAKPFEVKGNNLFTVAKKKKED